MKRLFFSRNNTLIIFFLLVGLAMSYLPYFNVISVKVVGMYYLLLILFFILPITATTSFVLALIFYLAIALLTFLKLNFFLDDLGVAVYFFLWLSLGLRIADFFRSLKRK